MSDQNPPAKAQITLRLDPELLDAIEAWRASQPVPPTRVPASRAALRLFMQKAAESAR